MKKTFKVTILAAIALVLIIGAAFSLTSCDLLGYFNGENSMTLLVKGNLDELYLGKFDPDYLELVDSTEEESMNAYLDGIESEAEFFAYYWGIISEGETLDDYSSELKEAIMEMYKKIYSHAKYTVEPASLQDDGSYTAKVIIEPIDIMVKADEIYENGTHAPLEVFVDKIDSMDDITEQEYVDLCVEYGFILVDMIEDLIPEIGYEEQKSIVVQIIEVDDFLQMNDDDFEVLDSYIITYP